MKISKKNIQEGQKYSYTNRFNQTFFHYYLGKTTEIKGVEYYCFKEAGLITGVAMEGVILLTEDDLKNLKKA
jgi:hypothetical protein